MDTQKSSSIYSSLVQSKAEGKKLLAILVDPDKFQPQHATDFLKTIPDQTTHLFVGGSEVPQGATELTVKSLKPSGLPIVLFPGSHTQLTEAADGLLFLSLYSGDNPEYLIGQQRKAARYLKESRLEVIPTAYLLIDGGNQSAVARVTQTQALPQDNIEDIVDVALAAQYCGARCLYLEAGSGALVPVSAAIIQAVRKAINLPLIVGGGIRSSAQMQAAYAAGADMLVMGTAFENQD
ncbi:geranylgeranylglyceryl/heptaprenylglyceryl phosphate synthase [Gilvibacter sediminis]|uniref:geranylgeranylglyceryl/heptaprenylglyceryl phosphate synthase n=1 Tax=Gilvibacter sediminis TaxID=379071 RepID=UPI002350EDC7|nr:geranylgeranylglyceryl/heptaprenylglyceryl phosphate synthase [Gilvibacter sediminis]MDC7997174.1 geranylgeranylglyceryl/heptaprenylglyceryl phosphate synthase [Gilvibacter sediminis]